MATPNDFCVSPFTEGADVVDFDCGNSDLNDFLTTDEVLTYQDEWCGYTFLVHRISDWALVGYYTTAADSIDLPADWIKKKSLKTHLGLKRLPAILLGRLATDNRYAAQGIGSMMLKHIITEELSSPTPARIMRLTAYQASLDWYLRRGFVFLSEKDEEKASTPGAKPRLFIDLKALPNPGVTIPRAK